MLRVLIAGCGSIGQRHLRNLQKIGETDIALFRTQSGKIEGAEHFPIYRDLPEALATTPDLVIVSNPTAFHLDVALPAARAGCNLFIEKPLSHSWEHVEELLRTIRAQQLTTMMGFDLRFDPGLRKVKSLLDEEAIGQIVSFQATVGQYLPDWRPAEDYRKGMSASAEKGGGVILDLIHELDYARWLIGPVAQIACFCGHVSSLDIETEDVAAVLLTFESGVIGTINLDYIQRVPNRTCRIVGEKGTIVWDYFGSTVRWFEAAKNGWEVYDYSHFSRNDRFMAEMQHVLACVQGQEKPVVDVFDGSQTLRLALAAKASAAVGKTLSL